MWKYGQYSKHNNFEAAGNEKLLPQKLTCVYTVCIYYVYILYVYNMCIY